MENCSFQNQLVAVMEVLAKAALAEINRRVEDSCAVLRLEINQSQQDIDALKKKCDQMETELKRTKLRARRKGFYPPLAERCPPPVKSGLSNERDTTVWDQQVDGGDHIQRQLGTDTDLACNAEPMLIKEESSEENIWTHVPEEVLSSGSGHPHCFEETKTGSAEDLLESYAPSENPNIPESLFPAVDSFDKSPEQQQNSIQSEEGLTVKHEKEEDPNKSTAPIGSDQQFVIENANRLLWSSSSSGDAGDTSFPYDTQQYEQNPSLISSQTGLPIGHSTPEDVTSPINSLTKSQSALISAAQVKKGSRTFGLKRLQPGHTPEEAHSALTQIYSIDRSTLIQQPAQHQHSNSVPRARDENKDLLGPNLGTSSHSGYSRSNFSITRRIRTPWRSGVVEKRFGCSYCGKSFMRFSQLKEHLRSHTGEKPFSCPQCGRSFTKQCNLIRHAVVHSGEKPHECALCGKCFTQRSSLTSHQKTAH